jgi:hypothetical protein
MMQLKDPLNPHAQRLLEILQCASPQPDEQGRLFLTHILYHESDMTEREVAYFVGRLVGLYYLDVINDVHDARTLDFTDSKDDLQALRQRLYDCGYDDWLSSTT